MTMANFKSKDPSRNRSHMRVRFTHTTNGLTRHHKWRPNRRWANTTNKNPIETHNLKMFILVKCSSLCCARWFFTQHSHMLSPALKQRVHRDDTAPEGTTRTNALLVLNKKNTRVASGSLTPRITNARCESSTRLLCRSHQAHRHRNHLVSTTWPTTKNTR